MQTITDLKDKGQQGLNQAVDAGKQHTSTAKLIGVTAGAAVAGSVAMVVVAPPAIALAATLLIPSVAMTVGAVTGGVLGWRWMRNRTGEKAEAGTGSAEPVAVVDEPAPQPAAPA